MENDDYYINNDIVKYVTAAMNEYTYQTPSTSVKSKDLSQFSTRELLNEAYRRGAIRPFAQRFRVANHLARDDADSAEYMKHVHQSVIRDLLIGNVDKFEKYGAIDMKMQNFQHTMEDSFVEAEIYICKHPKIIKKAGG